jgi:hypothetical protein
MKSLVAAPLSDDFKFIERRFASADQLLHLRELRDLIAVPVDNMRHRSNVVDLLDIPRPSRQVLFGASPIRSGSTSSLTHQNEELTPAFVDRSSSGLAPLRPAGPWPRI